jgi:hypothetical protein
MSRYYLFLLRESEPFVLAESADVDWLTDMNGWREDLVVVLSEAELLEDDEHRDALWPALEAWKAGDDRAWAGMKAVEAAEIALTAIAEAIARRQ